jgi:hypothetical protein
MNGLVEHERVCCNICFQLYLPSETITIDGIYVCKKCDDCISYAAEDCNNCNNE